MEKFNVIFLDVMNITKLLLYHIGRDAASLRLVNNAIRFVNILGIL